MNRVLPLLQGVNSQETPPITLPHPDKLLTQSVTTQHVDMADRDGQDIAADIVDERRNAVL